MLQNFDKLILNPNPHKPIPEKRKRDAFKKLVADVIGVRVMNRKGNIVRISYWCTCMYHCSTLTFIYAHMYISMLNFLRRKTSVNSSSAKQRSRICRRYSKRRDRSRARCWNLKRDSWASARCSRQMTSQHDLFTARLFVQYVHIICCFGEIVARTLISSRTLTFCTCTSTFSASLQSAYLRSNCYWVRSNLWCTSTHTCI